MTDSPTPVVESAPADAPDTAAPPVSAPPSPWAVDLALAVIAVGLATWAWSATVPPPLVPEPLVVAGGSNGPADRVLHIDAGGTVHDGNRGFSGAGPLVAHWQASGVRPTRVELQVADTVVAAVALRTAQQLGRGGVREVRIVPWTE